MMERSGAEIITFYSYKGGTGRSMQLANVAWILASNGKRVLMVDWDLEAPGLHRYFRPFLVDPDVLATDGLIDLLWRFTEAAMTPVPEADRARGWHEAYTELLPYTTAIVDWPFPLPGRIDLMPAGRQGPSYSSKVNSFNWQNFYDRLGGGVFLESVKSAMRTMYDYVLIDSRTGVSDTSGICTIQMPDTLVVCFTASNQSIEGCAAIVRSVREHWAADRERERARRRVLPLFARVDVSEKDKLNARRALIRKTFDPYLETVVPNALEEYWRDVEIPYVPWYSYEEVLAAFADKYKERSSVLEAAEALTRILTDGEITSMLERPSDTDRERVLRQFAVTGEPPIEPSASASEAVIPSPYPGMRPFTEHEASRFVGRAREIDDLLGRLDRGEREIYVIGPSGSGKSSLVQAGLLPALEAGTSRLERSFIVRKMRPGERPTDRLVAILEGGLAVPAVTIEALLARHPPAERILVFIDQFEELFSLADVVERQRFVAALRALRAESRCYLLMALRADFSGGFMESDLWPDLEGRISRLDVAPLRGPALRLAISEPARQVGVHLEARLCDQLVADAADEPGALPLVQETLQLLWGRRRQRLLSLADYEALGRGGRGLDVAIAERAATTMRALTPAQQTIARRVMLRLVSFGEGRADTRRQQPVRALRSASDDEAEFSRVLRQLVHDRLITLDGEGTSEVLADLAHEALITAWPPLREWVARSRADEHRRRWLEEKVREWIERGRGPASLLDAAEHFEVVQWMQSDAARELGYGADLPELVAASRSEIERAQRQAQEARRMVGMAYLEHGRTLLLDGRSMHAIPFLVAARTEGIDGPVLRMLFAQASRNRPLASLVGHRGPVRAVAVSADGTRVATASADNTALVWDAETGRLVISILGHQSFVVAVAFSPDGARLITGSSDRTARVWDASTGEPVTPLLVHDDGVLSVAFSLDGTRVVTASCDHTARVWDATTGEPVAALHHQRWVVTAAFSSDGARIVTASWDRTARVWDAATGKPVTPPLKHRYFVTTAAFSPDGTRVVTGSWDMTARIWDAAAGWPVIPVLEHEGFVNTAVFSPDGGRVLTASRDKTARIWDARTGKLVTAPLEHRDEVTAAAFSPDGTRVVTVSRDRTAQMWDGRTGTPVIAPLDHGDAVGAVAFSPDGSRLVTASDDSSACVWDVNKLTATSLEHDGVVNAAAFSADGTRVVTASDDRTARVWDAATGAPVTLPFQHRDNVNAAAFSSDSTLVVTASQDGAARVWDVRTGKLVSPPLEHSTFVVAAVFSRDGSRLVTTSGDKMARIWNARTGKQATAPLEHQDVVTTVAFSPDGQRVVTASRDGTARVWNARTGELLSAMLDHQSAVNAAAFSPDGARVVTACADWIARVWHAATATVVTPPLEHQGEVNTAVFSPDGSRVVTASSDKTARVWDAMTGKVLSPPLDHHGAVRSAAFSPDGTRVVTASGDMTARVWDATTGSPLSLPLAHPGSVRSAEFSPDGTRIITVSKEKTARIWSFSIEDSAVAELVTLAARLPHQVSELARVATPVLDELSTVR